MKIDISRAEKKTLFGGTQYVLMAKAELTPEEQQIHKKHLRLFCLFDNIESSVGEAAWMMILKTNASFANNYTGSGMTLKFNNLTALGNFEEILLEGFKKWKRQIELHQSTEGNLGTSRSINL